MSPRTPLSELHVSTVDEWREWLSQNHDTSPGVRLVFHRLETGKPTLTYDESVCEGLCFGWIDGLIRKKDEGCYTRRFTPRKPGSKWSSANRARVAQMEKAGRMTEHGRVHVQAAKADGRWEALDRPEVPETPTPEFQAALDLHPEARAFFEGLAPSYRGQYIAWIWVAKRDDTRQKRIAEALELLARGEKLGMR